MSDVLTAAELHAIYGPAWEAAPESGPRRGIGPEVLKWLGSSLPNREGDWTWVDFPGNHRYCDHRDAANACRCAAEDWLMKQAGELGLNWLENENSESEYGVVPMLRGREHWWGGPTIHHALAAAVVAVAKVK